MIFPMVGTVINLIVGFICPLIRIPYWRLDDHSPCSDFFRPRGPEVWLRLHPKFGPILGVTYSSVFWCLTVLFGCKIKAASCGGMWKFSNFFEGIGKKNGSILGLVEGCVRLESVLMWHPAAHGTPFPKHMRLGSLSPGAANGERKRGSKRVYRSEAASLGFLWVCASTKAFGVESYLCANLRNQGHTNGQLTYHLPVTQIAWIVSAASEGLRPTHLTLGDVQVFWLKIWVSQTSPKHVIGLVDHDDKTFWAAQIRFINFSSSRMQNFLTFRVLEV